MADVKKYISLIFLLSFPAGLFSQEADPLFLSDEIIHIELRSDFSSVQKERTGDPAPHDGELIYTMPGSGNVNLRVQVKSRGHFRSNPAYCSFPPLMVNFSKKAVSNTIFEGQDKIKLVTPCRDDNDVLDEYLAYRLCNIITERSLKVRLARVLYFDTGQNKSLFAGYSFFIEDEDEAARRLTSAEIKRFITPFDLDAADYLNLVLFEYMIGNRDWFVTSRKNIIVMQPSDSTLRPFAVPYDFDLSGFVNADYARPAGADPELLADKHEYKGIYFTEEEFLKSFDYFESLKGRFTETIMNMNLIPVKKRNEDVKYLNEFYRFIKNRKSAISYFRSKCETRKLYNLSE